MNKVILLVAALWLCACSSPKYTYYFDHYSTSPLVNESKREIPGVAVSPLTLQKDAVLASAPYAAPVSTSAGNGNNRKDASAITSRSAKGAIASDAQVKSSTAPLASIDRTKLRQAIKLARKNVRAQRAQGLNHSFNDQATQKLDNEVIVAIAFGAVGITLALLGGLGAGFWISGVLLLGIGLYFFIDWLSKR